MSSVFHNALPLLQRSAKLAADRFVERITDKVYKVDIVPSAAYLNGFVLAEGDVQFAVNTYDHAILAGSPVREAKVPSGGKQSSS